MFGVDLQQWAFVQFLQNLSPLTLQKKLLHGHQHPPKVKKRFLKI
jgi:hypothetical protein